MSKRAERLKQARMHVKLTQVEAADRLARSVSTIKGWESIQGSEPATLDDVVRVCNLYDISIDYYVTGKTRHSHCTKIHQRLIEAFEQLSDPAQQSLLQTLEQLAKDQSR
ncbi:MAG: helix-turn-helix domain-containing protein [Pontibacterium sp.]